MQDSMIKLRFFNKYFILYLELTKDLRAKLNLS